MTAVQCRNCRDYGCHICVGTQEEIDRVHAQFRARVLADFIARKLPEREIQEWKEHLDRKDERIRQQATAFHVERDRLAKEREARRLAKLRAPYPIEMLELRAWDRRLAGVTA